MLQTVVEEPAACRGDRGGARQRQPTGGGRCRSRAGRERDGLHEREFVPRLKAAVAASAELQERHALKSVGLAATMTAALVARGAPDPAAALASELGVLAFKRGFAAWSEGGREAGDDLARYTLAALDELRAATASLG